MDGHVNTIVIDFLNDSDCYCVIYLLHLPLKLLFELHRKDMKIRNDLYLQCHHYKNTSQRGINEVMMPFLTS